MKILFKSKSTKIVIALLLCIFSLFYLSTIAYSAFSSTMNITGFAHSRVETDVRITNFSLEQIVNATSNYEEFSKDTVSTSLSFKENAYAIYKVEVTNYGETDIGIYSIDGIPEGITYELIDYNLKDKLCNNSGKCNNYATKEFYIKIIGNSISTNLILNFDFRIIHKITYVNFNNSYINEVISGETITIDLSKDSPDGIMIHEYKYDDYNYENNCLVIKNVTGDITVEAINDVMYDYNYTGTLQKFVAPYDGVYKIELWGASGNSYSDGSYIGGYGAYTSGEINLLKGEILYINVGYIGDNAIGNSGTTSHGLAGGEATDVRTSTTTLSRIMVAAGGGGASRRGAGYGDGDGGAGGGLIGYQGKSVNNYQSYGYGYGLGGSQISGGQYYWIEKGSGLGTTGYYSIFNNTEMIGKFVVGGNGASRGGGGYYGGSGSYHGGAGGGSSFISGHEGCNAITENSTVSNIIHTGNNAHYSKKIFTNTTIIDGEGYSWTTEKGEYTGMPTIDGKNLMKGNTDNGYAKIKFLKSVTDYPIIYTNIKGQYQKMIKKGHNLIVDFKENAPPIIEVYINDKLTETNYSDGILTIMNVNGKVEIKAVDVTYEFDYSGVQKTFKIPYNGIYKVELWGAGGTNYNGYLGGLGSYTSGNIYFEKDLEVKVVVGGTGIDITPGYNGGGNLLSNDYGRSGGGATDIRLTDSILSRIMVAGAGGGASNRGSGYGDGNGGAGGGLIGYQGTSINNSQAYGYGYGLGGEQTKGGLFYWYNKGSDLGSTGYYSYFNLTQINGVYLNGGIGASSGGGGYYGGAGSFHGGAGGGSSFISGHNGCDAITEASTESNIIHTGQSIHYSNFKFTDTVMIDGQGYNWTTTKGSYIGMPTHDGTSIMTGNTGNGYAKITLIRLT